MSKPSRKQRRVRKEREREARLRARGVQILKNEKGETTGYRVPVDPELAGVLNEAMTEYEKHFGKAPGPTMTFAEIMKAIGRPLPSEEQFINETAQAMVAAGVAKHLIYAFIKTGGFLLTEENRDLVPEERVREFEDACGEYEQIVAGGGDPWEQFVWKPEFN
jgi:hypothetical protein